MADAQDETPDPIAGPVADPAGTPALTPAPEPGGGDGPSAGAVEPELGAESAGEAADPPDDADSAEGSGSPGGPVVVIDTTVFGADPTCSSTAWRVLAQATRAWGVRLVVPEVVFAEAVGGYGRRAEDALAGFDKWDSRYVGALGFGDIAAEVVRAIGAQVAAFEDMLRGKLDDIGVEVAPAPVVEHRDVVARAVARRRPCNAKGDGYRDTLNWLSVVELARGGAVDVVWVSDNKVDFGADTTDASNATSIASGASSASGAGSTQAASKGADGAPREGVVGPVAAAGAALGEQLHHHLVEDLAGVGAAGQVTWVRSLADAVAHLAAGRLGLDEVPLRAIYDVLEKQVLLEYVTEVALEHMVEMSLSPERAALPVASLEATVLDIGAIDGLEFKASALADAAAVVEFAARVSAVISVRFAPQHTVADGWVVLVDDESGVVATAEKVLRLGGIVEVDSFGRPVSGQVSSVRAVDDDPGRVAWVRRRAVRAARPAQESLDAARRTVGLSSLGQTAKFNVLDKVMEDRRKQLEAMRLSTELPKNRALEELRKQVTGADSIIGAVGAARRAVEFQQSSAAEAIRRATRPSSSVLKALEPRTLAGLDKIGRDFSILDRIEKFGLVGPPRNLLGGVGGVGDIRGIAGVAKRTKAADGGDTSSLGRRDTPGGLAGTDDFDMAGSAGNDLPATPPMPGTASGEGAGSSGEGSDRAVADASHGPVSDPGGGGETGDDPAGP